jgi:CRP-like cAMP-binding protein
MSEVCLDLLVRKLGTHALLSPEDEQAILELPYEARSYNAGSYLVREHDFPIVCGVIVQGYAFRQKATAEGTRQIVSLQIPGDAVDLQHLHLDVADHNVQALTRADVLEIPKAAIVALSDARPAVGRALFINVLVEASMYREWILNVGRRDARLRVAHLLCEFAARLDAQGLSGSDGYELPMSQEQMADALGLTSVHVNRTLRLLEAGGLLARNKRHIRFPDWAGLRNLCGFNASYLHLERQSG